LKTVTVQQIYQVRVLVRRDPLNPQYWIARALVDDELVVDQGRTPEEAVDNIREALELTLEDKLGRSVKVDINVDILNPTSD